MKRALIITSAVIVILGIGVFVYLAFFTSSAHLTVGSNANTFGTSSGTVPTSDTSSGAATIVAPNLVKITTGPVSAGEVVVDLPSILATTTVLSTSTTTATSTVSTPTYTAGDTLVRYIDRESGNVYEYRVGAQSLTRVSNKTLPGIQEASWLPDGSMAFVRFLSTTGNSQNIASYALPYNGTGGYFLQQDLDQVTVVGSSSVFTLMNGANGSIGSLAHADGSAVSMLFNSPLTSLIVHPSGSSFIASTRAAAEIGGYAFTIASGKFTPILGSLNGLTVLPSPSGKSLLYSYTDGSSFHMSVMDISAGAVTSLPLATITEKCVWTPDSTAVYCAIPSTMTGNLPDSWYQGTTSFTDKIWRIDLSSRLATLILSPSDTAKTDIDAVNLAIDQNGRVLVFRNKKDGSLWAYSL